MTARRDRSLGGVRMLRVKEFLAPLVYLSSNAISLAGVVLVTTATVLWLALLPSFVNGEPANAYTGILEFMLLPGLFFAGLALIPPRSLAGGDPDVAGARRLF